jgi:hypothetical protein
VLAVSFFAAWRAVAPGAKRLEPFSHITAKRSPLSSRIVRADWRLGESTCNDESIQQCLSMPKSTFVQRVNRRSHIRLRLDSTSSKYRSISL